ncbi:hypothetical protein D3C86_1919070 [compost metagenome]
MFGMQRFLHGFYLGQFIHKIFDPKVNVKLAYNCLHVFHSPYLLFGRHIYGLYNGFFNVTYIIWIYNECVI